MNTARFVAIAITTALTVPVTFAIVTKTSVQFVPVVFSQPTLAEIADAVRTYPGRTLGKIDSLAFRVLGDRTTAAVSENPVDQPAAPDLANKMDSTAEALSRLDLDLQKVTSEVKLLDLKWDSLQAGEATQALDELISGLGFDGRLAWLNKAWGWPELRRVISRVAAARESLGAVRQMVSSTDLQPLAYEKLKSALSDLESAQMLVGNSGDTAGEQTVYGHYKQVQELAAAWVVQRGELTRLLDQWNKVPASELEAKAASAAASVLALNQVPGADQLLAREPKSKILDLIGLVRVNESLLAQDARTPVVGTWIEEDPLVIRTLITNPSATVQRNIAVKYYLPSKIREKDILSHDLDLEVKYDSGREQYYVEGKQALTAENTKVLGVQVADVWQSLEERMKAFREASSEPVTAKIKAERYLAGLADDAPLVAGVVLVMIGVILLLPARPTGRTAGHTVPIRQFRAFSEDIGNSDL